MPADGAVSRDARWLRLPLRHPVRTAAGTVSGRIVVLVRHVASDGTVGWGEYAPWPAPPAGARVAVADACRTGHSADPELASALAAAAQDAAARAAGLHLVDSLTGTLTGTSSGPRHPVPSEVVVNALVDADADPEDAAAAVAAGFTTLKCKVGARAPDDDVTFVRTLRAVVGDDVRIRLDANCAWDVPTAVDVLRRVADCAVEFVEQPVAGFDALAAVRAATEVPVAVDEDLRGPTDLDRCLRDGAADVVVCKTARLGGPAAAVEVALRAADAGLGVVVAGMIESAVGLATALAVAAVAPTTGAAGLATADLLADDVADAPRPVDGRVALPDGPGVGVTPDPSALARLAIVPPRS